MLFFDAAHHHAQMLCLDDHAHTLRADLSLDGLGDLARQPFLDLQTTGEHVHQPRHLAQPDDPLVRQIGHVTLAEKRQQVVLAQAEKLDVLHDDHLVVADVERRAVQYVVNVLMIAAGQKLQRPLEALGRLSQPFAQRIFTDQSDHLTHVIGDAFLRSARAFFVQQQLFGLFVHGSVLFVILRRTRNCCSRSLRSECAQAAPWGIVSNAKKSPCRDSPWSAPFPGTREPPHSNSCSRMPRSLRAPRSHRGPPNSRSYRSEEHTSELQSLAYLVCRLLLEKKKQ